jgi:[protein-PII] uridylyltransferase
MRQVPVRVRELSLASTHQTAIEVAASDQPGLLARLAWIIAESGFSLQGAAITTFGERVVDVFFIEGKDGSCLSSEEVNLLCTKLKEEASLADEESKGKS